MRWPLATAFAALLVMAGGGCGGRDDGSNPEAAVRSLIGAARAGDRAAVYARFGPRTRARVDGLLASAQRTGMRLLRRDGNEAEVEVYSSASGDRQTIHTVREDKSWKVELPFR